MEAHQEAAQATCMNQPQSIKAQPHKNQWTCFSRGTCWCETLVGVAKRCLPTEVSSESWDKGFYAVWTAGRDGTASNKEPSEHRQHQATIQLALNRALLLWSERTVGHRAAQRNKRGPCLKWVSTDWQTALRGSEPSPLVLYNTELFR